MSLTEDIKDFALSIGYDRVGITTADDFTFYQEQITARLDQYDWGAKRFLSGVYPRRIMPSARSIIVTVTDYFKEAFPESLTGSIGRVYQERVYLAPTHAIHRMRSDQMGGFLEQSGLALTKGMPISNRLAAARAGVATFGRNNFAFCGNRGSYVAINAFVVDAELTYDQPTFLAPCPEGCRRCIDACPTGALYEPFHMNPRRCIAFNTYAVAGQYGEVPEGLPKDLRDKMGRWLYGCDVCQDVCPRNQHKLKATLPPNEYLARVAGDFDPVTLLGMSDEHFHNRVKAVLYYINEKKLYQRNAAVVLGNIGDPAAVPALVRAMENPEPVVRGHAAWALGRIGGANARRALDQALRRETNVNARQEIVEALDGKALH